MAWVMDTYSMHVRPHGDRRRHRQAGGDGRIARPPRGHGARLHVRHARGAQPPRHEGEGDARWRCRASATSARSTAELLAARGLQDRRDRRPHRRAAQSQGHRHRRGDQARTREHKSLEGFTGGEADHERRTARARRGRARAGGARERDHRQEREGHPRQDHLRGRQRPDDGRRRLDPRREGHLRDPRHPRERRRRHRLVLRVGAGPRRLLLGRGDGERAGSTEIMVDSFRDVLRPRRASTRSTCAPRRTCSRSAAWRRCTGCAASTPERVPRTGGGGSCS